MGRTHFHTMAASDVHDDVCKDLREVTLAKMCSLRQVFRESAQATTLLNHNMDMYIYIYIVYIHLFMFVCTSRYIYVYISRFQGLGMGVF